jgi:spore germination protein YaaH/putative cell wall-binding protein
MLLCFFLITFWLTSSKVLAAPQTVRLEGTDRYETSVKVSQDGWSQSNYVVIVSGENFPDGLAAAPLAKKYNAPILLTQSDSLSTSVINEIKRLNAKNAFIIGGTGSISQNVENQLTNLNVNFTRIQGQNRYETSLKIAEIVGTTNGVFICYGENFPDSLSVASIAAAKQMPIIFTTSQALPSDVQNFISANNISKFYIIGGTGVISDGAVSGLTNAIRLGGSDRYETNLDIINEFSNDINFNAIYVALGSNFPDALSASAAASKNSSPIILTNGSSITAKSLLKSKEDSISTIKVLGGTSLIPDRLVNNIFNTSKTVLGYTTNYYSGDTLSYNSLVSNSSSIDEIATDTYTVDATGNLTGNAPTDTLSYANNNKITTLAMISNNFDGNIAKNLLESSYNRQTFINNILSVLKANNYQGVNIDLEGIYYYDRSYFTTFMDELYTTLSPQGFEVTISVPAKTSDEASNSWSGAYDYSQLANYADEITLMTYDEHWTGGAAGPIASIDWVKSVVDYAVTVIPNDKILLGLAAYAYDWPSNGTQAQAYTLNQAYSIASNYGATINIDPTSESPYFNYTDSSGVYHTVWLENSTSIGYKLDLVNNYNLNGIAIWRLGLENPDFWTSINTQLNK